jgi:hypothetical protein
MLLGQLLRNLLRAKRTHDSHGHKNCFILHISTKKVFVFSSGAPPSILTAGGRVVNGTDANVGQYPFIVSSLHPPHSRAYLNLTEIILMGRL